jgi:hypothetical protein
MGENIIAFPEGIVHVRSAAPPNVPAKNHIGPYGLVLFYISNQAGSSLFQLGGVYPPFGLLTITIIGFSSYLMLIGIYSSAVSVAQDLDYDVQLENLFNDSLHYLIR